MNKTKKWEKILKELVNLILNTKILNPNQWPQCPNYKYFLWAHVSTTLNFNNLSVTFYHLNVNVVQYVHDNVEGNTCFIFFYSSFRYCWRSRPAYL